MRDRPMATAGQSPRAWVFVLLVALYAALAAGYFVLRYEGQWADSDTANLTVAAAAVMDSAALAPASEGVYGWGFAYQAVTTFLVRVSGISLIQLQFWVYPFVAALLSIAAFATYRQLTGDTATGALAALLLFLQPDFLFVIFRGSHEKVTWLVTLLALFLLAKSFGAAGRVQRVAVYVGLFYVVIFTLISSNIFFASSFVAAVAFSLASGYVLVRLVGRRVGEEVERPAVARLLYVLASTTVLWVLLVFYLYEPAAKILLELSRGIDRTAAVMLGSEPTFNPYATVGLGWVSTPTYLGLTLPTWAVGIVSFAVWAVNGARWLRGRRPFSKPQQLLLWLLYGAFGVQLAAAVALDLAKAISGNLQLRLFPVVMLAAVPLVASAVVRLLREGAGGRRRKVWAAVLSLLVLWSSGASLLKATNEPSFSNYWMFWTQPEEQTVQWVESNLVYRGVWLGIDGIRLSSHANAEGFGLETGNETDVWTLNEDTRDLVISPVDERLSRRKGIPVPDFHDEHRVYDNGETRVYHKRPRTPYQW